MFAGKKARAMAFMEALIPLQIQAIFCQYAQRRPESGDKAISCKKG